MVPKRALEEPSKLSFASRSPWNTLPGEVHMDSLEYHSKAIVVHFVSMQLFQLYSVVVN